jgi:hypothetical protein
MGILDYLKFQFFKFNLCKKITLFILFCFNYKQIFKNPLRHTENTCTNQNGEVAQKELCRSCQTRKCLGCILRKCKMNSRDHTSRNHKSLRDDFQDKDQNTRETSENNRRTRNFLGVPCKTQTKQRHATSKTRANGLRLW